MQEEPLLKDESSLEMPVDATDTVDNAGSNRRRFQLRPPLDKRRLIVVLALILLVLLAAVGGYIVTKKSTKKTVTTVVTINTQSLDNGTLNKLTAQAGTPSKQQLVITPDTVFKNTVQIHDAVTTDAGVNIGGNLDVKGSSTLQGSVGINGNLAVHGSISVSGILSAPSLNVGTLGITTLNASGALNFGGHLVPSGAVPTSKTSVAASGGTVTVSGNDTAGTVTITTSAGAQQAGEMVIISFHTAFATTPKVQLTPITSSAASLQYFATRNPTFFTIETVTAPAATTSYVFDYLITE